MEEKQYFRVSNCVVDLRYVDRVDSLGNLLPEDLDLERISNPGRISIGLDRAQDEKDRG